MLTPVSSLEGGLERLQPDLGVMQALVDRRDRPVHTEELVHRVHGPGDRVLHREHDIAGELGELAEEREVLRAVGNHLGTILRDPTAEPVSYTHLTLPTKR